jgi:hypothetical protein
MLTGNREPKWKSRFTIFKVSDPHRSIPRWFEPCALLLGLTLFLALACTIAHTRLLWYDEIFTRQVLGQGSWSKILAGLRRGLDQQPLVFFLLTAWTRPIGGEEVGLRLPAMLGFAFAGLSMYAIARRWLSQGYAIAAMTVPWIGWFNPLGVEARPYGLVIGFVSLALLGWTYRDLKPLAGRTAYIVGVLGAAAVHYYGFLVALPFGVAAAWTAVRTRRWDVWTILGCGCSFLPNLWTLSIIRDAIALYKGGAWNPPSWSKLLLSSYGWALAGLAAVFLASRNWKRQAGSLRDGPPDVRPSGETLACWAGFCAVPILAVVLAKTISGMITPRYFSMYSLGYGLLLAYLLARSAAGSRWLGYLAGGAALAVFLSSAAQQYQAADKERANVLASTAEIEGILKRPEYSKSRLLIGTPLIAMQWAYYSPELRDRIVFPADPVRSLRYLGRDSAHKDLLQLRGSFLLDIEPLDEFLHHEKHEFLVYHSFDSFLGKYFSEEPEFAGRLKVLMEGDDFVLFRVSPEAATVTARDERL